MGPTVPWCCAGVLSAAGNHSCIPPILPQAGKEHRTHSHLALAAIGPWPSSQSVFVSAVPVPEPWPRPHTAQWRWPRRCLWHQCGLPPIADREPQAEAVVGTWLRLGGETQHPCLLVDCRGPSVTHWWTGQGVGYGVCMLGAEVPPVPVCRQMSSAVESHSMWQDVLDRRADALWPSREASVERPWLGVCPSAG